MKVKYVGMGGYMNVPCYEDEKGRLYFDENNGRNILNLYTGAYRTECGEICGEPDAMVAEDIECEQPFLRHSRETDYMMLGRLQHDCEYFLGYGFGNEGILYYKSVEKHCDEMEKLWNSFADNEKPEWLSINEIMEYRSKMLETRNQKVNS